VKRPGVSSEPPPDLAQRRVTLVELADSIFRTHSIDRDPIFYGNSGLNRFDSPDQSYDVLYAGRDAFCAFIETFGKAPGTRIITTTALRNYALSELKPTRTLRLVDLTHSGALVRIGADGNLFAGPHEIAQLWSKVLHEHPCKADGLLYPSRLDPLRHAVVLFSDKAPKITELNRHSWYASGVHRALLVEILECYGMELIENQFVAGRKPAFRSVQPGMFD
jgi:hypothetical protein